jgi:hypothetical protein
MKMDIELLADIIEKGLMRLHISRSRDIGVVSNQNRASADKDLDFGTSWAFLDGAIVDLCLEADAINGIVKVARPTTEGFEYIDLVGDVSILRLDLLEESNISGI